MQQVEKQQQDLRNLVTTMSNTIHEIGHDDRVDTTMNLEDPLKTAHEAAGNAQSRVQATETQLVEVETHTKNLRFESGEMDARLNSNHKPAVTTFGKTRRTTPPTVDSWELAAQKTAGSHPM